MAELTIASTTVLKVVTITLLSAANVWASDSYAKKYKIGCSSCHTTGAHLNELGVTFKKNGHAFDVKNVQQEQKTKRDVPKDDKDIPVRSANVSQGKPEPANGEGANGATIDSSVTETEKPLPEIKVYSWKGEDGTAHFSDTPHIGMQTETKPASGKTTKIIKRSGVTQLSAIMPKLAKKAAAKKSGATSAAPHSGKPILTGHVSPVQSDTVQGTKSPVVKPKSYEKCMEQILAGHPTPVNPEAAMQEFQEAENNCAPLEKVTHQ